MAQYGRVHPNCTNASNPYHECGMACLEKIGQGHEQKEKKKLDNGIGTKEGSYGKKKDGERKVLANCIKASNPYHECDENCLKRNGEAEARKIKNESGSWSFGKKKKGSEIQPISPRIIDNGPLATAGYRSPPPRTHYPSKKTESENDESFSSSEQHSGKIYSREDSSDEGHIQYSQSVTTSGPIVMADQQKDPSKETPTKHEKDKKPLESSKTNYHHEIEEIEAYNTSSPINGALNFSFSGISHAPEDSDEEEAQSVISDSCVSVGKYHVRASVSSVLQSIIDKYGDIAANCNLESISMRGYYLECLCSVVQELQSIPSINITKGKVKEMLAVLKDVESAGIEVNWLRDILHGISEAIELTTLEVAKVNCDNLLESTKKELETRMKELADKEKEVAETRARLSKLETDSSLLDETVTSMRSKVEIRGPLEVKWNEYRRDEYGATDVLLWPSRNSDKQVSHRFG